MMRHLQRAAQCVLAVIVCFGVAAEAQTELSYGEYRDIAKVAHCLRHCAMFEPLDGEPGMFLAVGDRFGKVNVYRMLPGQQHERVWMSRSLDSAAEEILIADLDGDGLEDNLVCRTSHRIYIFKLGGDFFNVFESQPNDFSAIRAFTVANVDGDPAAEIVLNADDKIHYIDGVTFTREFTSLNNYQATVIRCGDVDGDGRPEIVLNTGQVLDSSSGDVKWQDEVFGTRLELLDFDGDGVLEVLTEGEGTPMKVWDIDYKQEKRF